MYSLDADDPKAMYYCSWPSTETAGEELDVDEDETEESGDEEAVQPE